MNNPRLPLPVRAIKVKYLPATNYRPSRFKAVIINTDISATVSYQYEGTDGGKRAAAFEALKKAENVSDCWKGHKLSETFALNNDETIFTLSL